MTTTSGHVRCEEAVLTRQTGRLNTDPRRDIRFLEQEHQEGKLVAPNAARYWSAEFSKGNEVMILRRHTVIMPLLLVLTLICSGGAQTEKPANSPPNGSQASTKHTGGKDDINAIGSRNVGGKGLGNWYSLEKEIRIGKSYAETVEATAKLLQDPPINEYVNRIGQNLVRNSDAKVPFTIKIVDSDEVNAFALPGGFFYINTGLILAADSEAELAGVMSHEIAHVAARHATRQMTRSNLITLASIPLIFAGGGVGMVVREAANLAVPLSFSKFSRGFESEADYLGVQYMYKAGYDPQAFVSFFEKATAGERKKPGTLAKAFATHPQTSRRLAKTQEEIAKIMPLREQYIVTTSEFEEMKARLMALEKRRAITDEYRPTLRRSAPTDSGGASERTSASDDDRPTLKRRDDDRTAGDTD